MRKFVSYLLVLLVSMVSGVPTLHAQERAKATMSSRAHEAVQSGQSRKGSLPPQVRICDGHTGFSSNLSTVRTDGPLLVSGPSLAEQMRMATKGIHLYGNVQFSNAGRLGIWDVGLNGEFSDVFPERISNGYDASVVVDGVYHLFYMLRFAGLEAAMYVTRDVKTWENVPHTAKITQETMPCALCTDGSVVYGQYYDNSTQTYKFGILNLTSLSWTYVSDCSEQWNGLAYGKDKNLYAVGMTGKVYRIVPASGSATELGSTGVVPYYATGATIDSDSGRMFWTVKTQAGNAYLYEINTTTGGATKLAELAGQDQVCGIFVPFIAFEDAPDAVSNLKAEFTNGTLQGKVSFTCPTTTYGGTAASGAIDYKVISGKEVISSGTTAYGANVSVDVTASNPGEVTYTVVLSNQKGEGPEAKVTAFAGSAYPQAPAEVTIQYEGSGFSINWTAVTKNMGGGSLDASKVTYTVTRFPGEEVVAENTSATKISDAVDIGVEKIQYYYTVVAVYEGMKSEATSSNKVKLGVTPLPYNEEFNNAECINDFTIIDANEDGKTWQFSTDLDGTLRIAWNKELDMNDWAITQGFRFEAGKNYKISFVVQTKSYEERLEVKAGNVANVAGMTIQIIEEKGIKSSGTWTPVEGIFTPSVSGLYYIGIHGCSEKDKYYLYVDNLKIEEVIEADVPAKVSNLAVTPASDGSRKATVSGKAPTTTFGGSTLSSISKIEICRDNELVHTVTSATPGGDFAWEDAAIPTTGNHIWEVTAYNDKGRGESASVSAYIGFDKPSAPANVKMTEAQTGKVHVSWNAVTTDIHGVTLPTGSVKYRVVDASDASKIYQDNVTGTEIDITVVTSGQKFVQVAVFAINDAGASEGSVGPFMAIGFPYALPYVESFANGSLKSILGIQSVGGAGAAWSLYKDGGLGINSVDGDNGFIAAKMASLNDASILFTGKINLAGATSPTFSFYTYNVFSAENGIDINEIEVLVREVGTDAWTTLKSATVDALCGGEPDVWKPVKVSLSAYKGKNVQVGVKVICKRYVYVMIDKMQISESLPNDLAIAEISAPENVAPNVEYDINIQVENPGSTNVSEYSVELYRNNSEEPFKVIPGVEIAPDAKINMKATDKLGFTDEDAKVVYHAVVKLASDPDQTNNTSKNIIVTRVYSDKAAPTGFSGTLSGDRSKVNLHWSAPVINGGSMLADLENLTSWANQNVGGWTFVDMDNKPRGGFQNLEIPNNPTQSKGSFFVFEQGGEFNQSFAAHSGTKYFASLFNYDASQVDDWLISPLLDGSKQTISFWAKSYSSTYLESMEILYSTTDRTPANFTSVKTVASVPGSWTEYTVELPAGAKYFAVRNNGTDKFMLMLDDFTFKGVPEEVVGYNIYRDGIKLNSAPIEATEYTDNAPLEGTHRYDVTAVYTDGEESAPVTTDVTAAVGMIESGISVVAGKGYIAVSGAEGKPVSVVTLNGVACFRGVPEGDLKVVVAPGVYIVRIADGNIKVIVR